MSSVNNYTNDTNMKASVDETNVLENNLLFKIELTDGTSQWIQIPEHQVQNLCLQFQTETNIVKEEPVITSIEENKQASNKDDIPQEINDDVSHFVYKIIKPEDLNLKPVIKGHLPRGRPRKRPNQKTDVNNVKMVEEPQKIIKQVRTRSGRITKPPKHIEKDFKKIDISDDIKNETDLKTSEFKPLTTNETPAEEPLQVLEQHSRKRNIGSRFRCPTCNKAYLGRIRMMSHFDKHPDHGPLPKYCKLKHDTAWNFLILTSQKYKEGPKGVKFCQELDVLLQNARTLAKYLFKPVSNEKEGYFINETLAYIFGITAGKYDIDETELNRDVTLYEYLENIDSNNGINIKNEIDSLPPNINSKVENKNKKKEKSLHDKNIENNFQSFDYMINNSQTDNISNYASTQSKNDYNNDIVDIEKNVLSLNNISLTLDSQANHSNLNFSITDTSHHVAMDKEQIKNNCTNSFVNSPNSNRSINNSNCLAVVKYEMQPKHSFVFNNHEYSNITTDLDSVMDTNQIGNLANYDNLEIKEESVFDIENHKQTITSTEHISEKQNNHITLQNELHDVDELILVNVDSGQVSSILDNSSNSDDIMNVDQFVNERFKKLTEQDMDIQNNLLNLELPPLDMFQFHTS